MKPRLPQAGLALDLLRHSHSNPLDSIFSPKTVAVIGATENPGSVGGAVMKNLASFKGRVIPINPKRPQVFGIPAFPSISAVGEPIDLAVIATPATTVPGIIKQCAEAGIPGAIIISAGFKEIGAAGVELERQVLEEARKGGMRIIGPNCLGVMNPHSGLNATFAASMAHPGSVAFVSQSGALCTAILDWSLHEHVGFSAFVSVGSMLDVGWGDLIYHLGNDPHTRSIVAYMESVGDARSFLSAAREVALNKPIIVIKVGRTEAAAKAAASHTGSMTGGDDVLDAAFRRAGVLRVDTIAELFDMAEVLGKQPRPAGPRLAIVTNAGGPGALATDMLVGSGGQLAALSDQTRASLDAMLPPHWSHGNPMDILGDADAERYGKATELAAADPNNDGVLVILTPQEMTDATGTAKRLTGLAHSTGKPLLASWMGGPSVSEGETILNQANIPTFKYPDRAARAFVYMWRYSSNLKALYETPALPEEPEKSKSAAEQAGRIIAHARKTGRTLLTEAESKQVLTAYGIPTVPTLVARTEEEAVAEADKLGYPVVVKLFSETLTHKTDVGGVHLNLRNATAVRKAWQSTEKSVTTAAGKEHFLGVTVQPMISMAGYELILGSSIDPQFGPVLLFGTGGQLVEVFKDRSLGLPPLNATLARRLIERTQIFKALQGVRGRPPVDIAALEQLLVRFSHLVTEQSRIKEIDINPLLVSPESMVALDARILLHEESVTDAKLPKPAIRPYPRQYVTPWKTKQGNAVLFRPIRPEDEPAIVLFHETLSERSVYMRYFSPLRLEQRIAHERLARICYIDYDREMALVVEHKDPATGENEIIAVGRLSKLVGTNEAEFALLVSDKWHKQGLGTQLLKTLVQIGRDEKIERIVAVMLPENYEMQQVSRLAGFKIHQEPGGSEWRAEINL